MALTGKNEIVGTLYYMSPEQLQAQATGQEIDGRSDIFSFGLVLYEMLTGKRAFEGSSPASVIAAIMERPAPSIADVAPPALDRVLKKCLAKDPDERWQTARDLKGELEWIASASESGIAAPALPTPRHRSWLPWCVAAIFLLALIPANIIHFRETPAADPVLHLSVPLPGDVPAGFLALSPDGRRLVISFTAEGKTSSGFALWIRPSFSFCPALKTPEPRSGRPTASPSGSSLTESSRPYPQPAGRLRCCAREPGTPWWNLEPRWSNSLQHKRRRRRPLQRVNASGGACTVVTKPEGGNSHGDPEFLPDGKHFVYVVRGGDEAKRGLYVASLDTASTIPPPAGSSRMYPAPYSLPPLRERNTAISCSCGEACSWRNRSVRRHSSLRVTCSRSPRKRLSI